VSDRIEIRLPSRASWLGAVRSVVREFVSECLDVQLTPEEVAEVQISLQEACINAVRHAHRNDPSRPLLVSIIPEADRVTIEVVDEGPGLPARPPPDPDPARLQEGGYGLFIMRQAMDEVRSERRDGRHVLSLVKRIAGKPRREPPPPAEAGRAP